MTLHKFLLPESLLLTLSSEESSTALEEVMKLLKQDSRIPEWEKLHQAILARPAFCLPVNNHQTIIIFHGRTQSVQDLVMAVGRSSQGISFESSEQPVHLIFVVGIPHALSHEYLRVMGSIARACKDSTTLEKLLSTKEPQEFIEILSSFIALS